MTGLNRYNAATGSYIYMPEPERDAGARRAPAREQPPAREPEGAAPGRESGAIPVYSQRAAARERPAPARLPGPGESPLAGLDKLLGGFSGKMNRRLASLETEDLLLCAVIYLMYRESGDGQLLLVLAAMLLL